MLKGLGCLVFIVKILYLEKWLPSCMFCGGWLFSFLPAFFGGFFVSAFAWCKIFQKFCKQVFYPGPYNGTTFEKAKQHGTEGYLILLVH